MIVKMAYQDAEHNSLDSYWNELRSKDYSSSFEEVKRFLRHKQPKRRRLPLRPWQWATALLLPLLVLLACTKTQTTEPLGFALVFSAAEDNVEVKKLLAAADGIQVLAESQPPGQMSYTCFIPPKTIDTAAMFQQLRNTSGVFGFAITPVNTVVKESLLSQLSFRIFRMHINATGLSDDVLKKMLEEKLNSRNIKAGVAISYKDGQRQIKLLPQDGAGNYSIDLSVNDSGLITELQEEQRLLPDSSVDLSQMPDASIRAYVRKVHNLQVSDEQIDISRKPGEIIIRIKDSDQLETIMRFKAP